MRGIRQALEGERGDDGHTADGMVLLHYLHLQQSGVEDPIPCELPTGDGHGFNEGGLIGGLGLKLIDQGVHQFVELRGGFGLQHDAARELVVAAGVLRGGLLAFNFGDGSGGGVLRWRGWPGFDVLLP